MLSHQEAYRLWCADDCEIAADLRVASTLQTGHEGWDTRDGTPGKSKKDIDGQAVVVVSSLKF